MRILASERLSAAVEVDSYPYVRSHGKQPRGTGGWYFSKFESIDFGKHESGKDYIRTPVLPYSKAVAFAKQWANKVGATVVYTQP